MSKRFYPEHQGDRKRAKLNISISDHNFPLSQNSDQNKDVDTWGDDNDDEILLLASQACEQAYNTNDVSLLPDYSICMQPGSTSTQCNPSPSTSKTEFTFKKPSAKPVHSSSIISTNLKEKCNRISSPLPGLTSKITPKSNALDELTDEDFIFSDKIFKGQDSDHTYRQLLLLQEENAKLKSENGKLLEKCVTKEGEASILRTQLKSCQVSVDNARLEKIKAQEKVQMEWTDKMTTANNQMSDLRTQLDFKNLEIISIKEKCKKLESTKLKMTQVTLGGNDISSSQRRQSSSFHNESTTQRRVKVSSNAAQTDNKAQFIILNKTISTERSTFSTLLPLILEPSSIDQYSIIDYNEKLSRRDSPQKCRVYSTFHRIPTTLKVKEKTSAVQLSLIYQDLTCIASGKSDKNKYFNVFNAAKSTLAEVYSRLETISKRMTTAFQKEMDEKYIESTSTCLDVTREDLLRGRSIFKEEQEILARRLVAMLAHILESSNGADMFRSFELSEQQNRDHFLESISRICSALDNASCATLYSGLLLSITVTIQKLLHSNNKIILEIIKTLLTSRPMPFVVLQMLVLVRKVSLWESFRSFCPRTSLGNLKTDYDQGVLLYKKDSCYFQVLLKQVETCLKCIESQKLTDKAVQTTRQLIVLYNNITGDSTVLVQDKSRCDCLLGLVQVIVYALRICAVMLNNSKNEAIESKESVLSLCRCGILTLYQCTLRDGELVARLAHNEGHLMEFCELMRSFQHDEVYANMLSELAGTLQSSPEETPPSFHRQPWLKSFDQFSIAD